MVSHPKFQLGYLLLTLITLTLSSFTLSDDPRPPTVYQILPKFGLPSGLLPDSVTGYSLSANGSFVVELRKPCYVRLDYLVYYEKKVTGKLKLGSITDLDGIQVQRFFLWFDVNEIKVDLPPSESIYFQVGFISKKLNVDQFETVRSCRDNACSLGLSPVPQLPSSVDEVQMLITE